MIALRPIGCCWRQHQASCRQHCVLIWEDWFPSKGSTWMELKRSRSLGYIVVRLERQWSHVQDVQTRHTRPTLSGTKLASQESNDHSGRNRSDFPSQGSYRMDFLAERVRFSLGTRRIKSQSLEMDIHTFQCYAPPFKSAAEIATISGHSLSQPQNSRKFGALSSVCVVFIGLRLRGRT